MSLLNNVARPYAKKNINGARFIAQAVRQKSSDGVQSSQVSVCQLEKLFYSSLQAASSCHRHKKHSQKTPHHIWSNPHNGRDSSHPHSGFARSRSFSSYSYRQDLATISAPCREPDVATQEYLELVNTYPRFKSPRPYFRERVRKKAEQSQHLPLAPRLVITPEQEERPPYKRRRVLEAEDLQEKARIEEFVKLLNLKLASGSYGRIWRAWQALPKPRPCYLTDAQIHRFFRHLTWVEFKSTPRAMQNYFTVLESSVDEEVELHTGIWNTAIAFAGRWLRNSKGDEIKGAVENWMRMENAGHQATGVTFHILFDVAIRAGRYALADTILNETKERGISLHRHYRISLIRYAGIRGDGDAVRQQFRDFVNAGEIVDTGVMNCVILSLLRAGESAGAEHVFQRMKTLHETKFGTRSPSTWQERRQLGNMLDASARALKKRQNRHETSFFGGSFSLDDEREKLQEATPIAPNARTYRILIQFHSSVSGNLTRTEVLIREMQAAGFTFHGSLYVHLFRGFSIHGGRTGDWSRVALEELWRQFIAAVMQHEALDSEASRIDANEQELPSPDSMTSMQENAASLQVSTTDGLARPDGQDWDAETTFDLDFDLPMDRRPPVFNRAIAFAVVRAFRRCSSIERTLDVWEEVVRRWTSMTDDDKDELQSTVYHRKI